MQSYLLCFHFSRAVDAELKTLVAEDRWALLTFKWQVLSKA